jgi:orotate phosphoribosyltransferase
MDDLGVHLHYLTTWWDVLKVAKASGHFEPHILTEVENFLNDPAKWSAAHGGISEFGQENAA